MVVTTRILWIYKRKLNYEHRRDPGANFELQQVEDYVVLELARQVKVKPIRPVFHFDVRFLRDCPNPVFRQKVQILAITIDKNVINNNLVYNSVHNDRRKKYTLLPIENNKNNIGWKLNEDMTVMKFDEFHRAANIFKMRVHERQKNCTNAVEKCREMTDVGTPHVGCKMLYEKNQKKKNKPFGIMVCTRV